MDSLAHAVLREMARRGISIADLSEASGVDRFTLGRWLGGRRSVRVRTAERILVALDLVVIPRRDEGETGRPHRPRPAGLGRPRR